MGAALLAWMLCAGGARAQQSETPPSVSVIVPVVGNVPGGGIRWITSVQLRNENRSPVDVWLVLPATTDAPATNLTLGPGETVTMRDVIGDAFGMETALSPLQVITSGRRSVTIGVTIFAMRGAEVAITQPVPVDYGNTDAPVRVLPGLAFSDEARTNVGLVNLSLEQTASFTLALQRIAGRNIAITRISVPPATIVHTPIQSLFPMIAKGNDFSVIVETADPETYAYASVIDNSNTFAHYIRPAVGVSVLPAAPR